MKEGNVAAGTVLWAGSCCSWGTMPCRLVVGGGSWFGGSPVCWRVGLREEKAGGIVLRTGSGGRGPAVVLVEEGNTTTGHFCFLHCLRRGGEFVIGGGWQHRRGWQKPS